MTHIPANLRRLVQDRSGGRCKYCHLAQAGQEATFHIDHIKPVAAGGLTVPDNLALACVSCSLRKAAQESAVDPVTGETVSLFNPRTDKWSSHFEWEHVYLTGTTAKGLATIKPLDLNRQLILAIRLEESLLGLHP